MKKFKIILAILICVFALSIASANMVRADTGTLYVDDDGNCAGNVPCYTTIQSAVNTANPGDTVYVYAGTYYEHVTIDKALTLQAVDEEIPIIDGGGIGDVLYVNTYDVAIFGIKVSNGEDVNQLILDPGIEAYVGDDGVCDGKTPCYTTIQAAVDTANSGNTVYVYAGIYDEHVTIDKALTLRGEDRETLSVDGVSGNILYVTADDFSIIAHRGTDEEGVIVKSPGSVYYVDDDGICGGNTPCYTIIQDAVNSASSGDTVYIYAGAYYEHVTINKTLTLQGEDRATTIVDGGGSGNVIYVIANYVTVSGLTVTNGDRGIQLIRNGQIHHVTIRDVIVTSNIQGIVGESNRYSGAYHIIEDCIISNNEGTHGLYLFFASKSIIRNCEVFGNTYGLRIGWDFDTLVTSNQIHDNRVMGVLIDSTRNSITEKNVVWNNTGAGIPVGYVARNNTVRDNVVCQNRTGIYLNYAGGYGNKIFHNDLIANDNQARDKSGRNIWDNGYPSGGNYWSDYTGADDFSGPGQNLPGSDGIGDTPYVFDGDQDNYPKMERWNTWFDWSGPIASYVVASPNPAAVGVDITATANLDDSTTGDIDITSAEYSLDGGETWNTMSPVDGSFDSVVESATATISNLNTGVYRVCVRGTDACGSSGSQDCILLAVYDPSSGFVTGGGWITSPSGAYTPDDPNDPDVIGKANFGFVSRYKKGATIPSGQTEFQFKAGYLNFHSDTYEWLVINQGGTNAQYKGSGTINGEGDYKFMLWAGDDDPDTFRIKIWQEDEFGNEVVTYDNGFDQAIGGGSIVIHTK